MLECGRGTRTQLLTVPQTPCQPGATHLPARRFFHVPGRIPSRDGKQVGGYRRLALAGAGRIPEELKQSNRRLDSFPNTHFFCGGLGGLFGRYIYREETSVN